jgi:FtsH-binding integral membrane protein
MWLYWLLFLPLTYSLIDASRDDRYLEHESKEFDDFFFDFKDQLSILKNETIVLMKLYNQSIIQTYNTSDVRDSYQYRSTNVTSLAARDTNPTLDPAVRDHLHKVYRHLLIMIATAGAGVASISLGLAPVAPLLISLLFLLSAIGFSFTSHKLVFSLSTAFFSGLMVGILTLAPAILAAIPLALAGTAAIFLTFTVTALIAPSDAFLKWGGTLASVLLATILVSLFSIFFPVLVTSAFGTAITWISLVLFSVFVGYDTQKMIEKAKFGFTDYISDAYSLFLDFFNILMQIMDLIARGRKKD